MSPSNSSCLSSKITRPYMVCYTSYLSLLPYVAKIADVFAGNLLIVHNQHILIIPFVCVSCGVEAACDYNLFIYYDEFVVHCFPVFVLYSVDSVVLQRCQL